MTAIAIAALDHVVLRVADLERAKAFYRDVLGCPVEKWQPEIGLLQMRAGAALIDLVTLDGKLGREGSRRSFASPDADSGTSGPARGGAGPGAEGHNLDHFCVRLERFDEAALRAHLAKHGVACGEALQRYGAEGTGPSLYIKDPDGNTVELKAPP
jgi:catechol 2,3-dioxygenase-like lactoylglutathione lyase family enzyme